MILIIYDDDYDIASNPD